MIRIKPVSLFMLALIPLIFPRALEDIFPLIELPLNIWRVVACVSILALYFLVSIKGGRYSPYMLFVLLFNLTLIITYGLSADDANKVKNISFAVASVAVCALFDLCLRENAEVYLKAFVGLFSGFLILNLIFYWIIDDFTAFIPAGASSGHELYFLGIANQFAHQIIPYTCALCLYSYLMRGRFTRFTYFMLCIISMTVFAQWSATCVVAWLVILVYALIIRGQKYLRRFLTYRNACLAAGAMFAFLVVFRMGNVFAFFIEGFLKKSVDFTSRTRIWDVAFQLIRQRPVFGWGTGHLLEPGFRLSSSHNYYLEILLQGGAVCLALWLAIVIICGKPVQKYKSHPFAVCVSACVFSLLTAYQMEAYVNKIMPWILLTTAYRLPDLIRQYEAKWGGAKAAPLQPGSAYIKRSKERLI